MDEPPSDGAITPEAMVRLLALAVRYMLFTLRVHVLEADVLSEDPEWPFVDGNTAVLLQQVIDEAAKTEAALRAALGKEARSDGR